MNSGAQVGARKAKDRIRTSQAQMNSVSMQLGEQMGEHCQYTCIPSLLYVPPSGGCSRNGESCRRVCEVYRSHESYWKVSVVCTLLLPFVC